MSRPVPVEPSVVPVEARGDRPFLPWAAAIFGVALAIRLLHVWLLSRSPYFDALMGDARGYDEWARRIAGGDWIGTEVFYQAPLYPYFLGVLYSLFGHSLLAVRLVQAVVGAGSAALLGLAGYRLFSPRVGQIAGFALALYAPAIFFDALLQKSVLDLLFIALALWLIARIVDQPNRVLRDGPPEGEHYIRRDAPGAPEGAHYIGNDAGRGRIDWLLLGLAMGAMSLTRENALVFIAVILVWALVPSATVRPAQPARPAQDPRAALQTSIGPRARNAATFLVGLTIVLVPVAARNYAVGGGFYLTTSQFGPNFYIGNNPQADGTYASLRFGRGAPEYERIDATELAEHALKRTLTPAEVSGYWTDRALTFITREPGAWLTLMGRKVLLLVNATEMIDTEAQESHADWSWVLRGLGWVGHLGILAPLALVGLVVVWPERRRLWVLYVMLAAYAASVVIFYVFARYRLPLVPLLLLFAAAGVPQWTTWVAQADGRSKALLGGAVVAVAVFCNWPVLSKPLMMAISETNLAGALQTEGKLNEAASHYQRAIELQPDYAPAFNNLGVLQRAAGQVDAAIATYQPGLARKGDYPDAHYNLANALLAKGLASEAAEHFTIALKSIPDSAGAANNLGVALSSQNRTEDAVAAFRAAVAADPNSAVAHRNLADALSAAGQLDAALAEYQKALTLDPKDPSTPYNLGVVLLEAGRNADAVNVLRTAVALAPQSVDAHNNLGIALGTSGDLQAALAEFRQALRLDPSSAEARRNLEMAQQALAPQGTRTR